MTGQVYHSVFNCPWHNVISLYSKESFAMSSLNIFQSSEIIIDSRMFLPNCTSAKNISHQKASAEQYQYYTLRLPYHNYKDMSHLQSDYFFLHSISQLFMQTCINEYLFPFILLEVDLYFASEMLWKMLLWLNSLYLNVTEICLGLVSCWSIRAGTSI